MQPQKHLISYGYGIDYSQALTILVQWAALHGKLIQIQFFFHINFMLRGGSLLAMISLLIVLSATSYQ